MFSYDSKILESYLNRYYSIKGGGYYPNASTSNTKRNSLEYTNSPSMMNQSFNQQQQQHYMNQQPGSIPSMPHTPIQAPQSQQPPRSVAPAAPTASASYSAVHNSGGGDNSSYMAPHSVPTPSR